MKPSDLELQILALLWARGPSTGREVLENMPDGKERAYTSILSILQLMDKKGLVKRRREGLTDRWRPAHARKTILGQYLTDQVRKLFGGSPSAALQELLGSTKVTEAELNEIERVIQEHRAKNKSS
jgi:predicted transcriptional regulator